MALALRGPPAHRHRWSGLLLPAAVLALLAALPLPPRLQGSQGANAFALGAPSEHVFREGRDRGRGRVGSRYATLAARSEGPLTDADGLAYARFDGGTLVEVVGTDGVDDAGRPVEMPLGREGTPAEAEQSEEWFVGEVKSYAPQQGYGFIECREVFERYKSDVFLHRNQVEGGPIKSAKKGDAVRFSIEINKNGRPQARNVERYVAGDALVSPTKNFVGKVKRYSEELGYGFIACEDTRNLFGTDIFLHRNQLEAAGLAQGNMATFTVEVSAKGQPQARNVAKFSVAPYQEALQQQGEAEGVAEPA